MRNKKGVALAVSALALGTAAFAQVEGLTFSNEVSSDVWHAVSGDNKDTFGGDGFAGISEEVVVDFESEKVDVGADLVFKFTSEDDQGYQDGGTSKTARETKLSWDDLDAYVRFRPIEVLQLGWSNGLHPEGSYLPVWDDNLDGSDYGAGDGFEIAVFPIEGLTIGAGINFTSWFDGKEWKSKKDDEEYGFHTNIGAEYAVENIGAFGVVLNDIVEDFGLGIYASITAIDKMTLNLGFTYDDDGAGIEDVTFILDGPSVSGDMLASAGLEWEVSDAIGLAFDAATNIAFQDDYDFYVAGRLDFALTEAFGLHVKALTLLDVGGDNKSDPVLGAYPFISYQMGNHTFKAGIKTEFGDHVTAFAFPVSWTYEF